MWVKVDEKFLSGSMRKLRPDERAVFIDLLLVAARSETPGVIQVAPGIPWTDMLLARRLVISKALLKRARARLIEIGSLTVDENGCPRFVNWTRFQSEYARTKQYRSGPDVVAKGVAKGVANATANATAQREEGRGKRVDLTPPHPPAPARPRPQAALKDGWEEESRREVPA